MEEENIWKILLIDDDEDDYLITREMLAQTHARKVDLTWAESYSQGRDLIFSSQRFDAVLMDYDLGANTGIDLIREASTSGYAAPFILLTGRGSFSVDVEAMRAGASIYLIKTEINPLLLERSIRYAIERKQIEQALLESEERFRTLANNISQLAWMADETGWIFWYNQRWFDYTGTTLEEMQGWGWKKVHHPDHVERVVKKSPAQLPNR